MYPITQFSLKWCFLILTICLITFQLKAQETKKMVRSPFDFKTDPVRSRFISFQEGTISDVNAAYNRSVDSTFHLDKNYTF